jgi:long-subunit acyl-CoA synthetase (AMP-forming)
VGATVTLLSPQTIGMTGSSQINTQQLFDCITQVKPTVLIIIPQLLLLLIHYVSKGGILPQSLRYIAMGGAPVSSSLLTQAEQLNIPVFQGYGLSEATSVVTVNNPSQNKLGSVGQVLTSHHLKIMNNNQSVAPNSEGEIFVQDHLFTGYLGKETVNNEDYLATGDMGHLDEQGFLYITGRKKNIINTSYGRNIAPEWLEKELDAIPEIAQSLIIGHGRPHLIAIIVIRAVLSSDTQAIIEKKIEPLNQQLPDYAKIHHFIIADHPFSLANNQLTGTHRPKRAIIYQAYQPQIEHLYAL